VSQGDDQRKALTIDQIFAYRLRDTRLSKQWSQQRLAEAMHEIGWDKISQQTITKIEAGAQDVGGEIHAQPRRVTARGVSIAEAIAFAVALDVPPPSLFLPIIRDDDIALAPDVRVDADTAHAWARGERPLKPDNEAFYRFQTFARRATLSDLEHRLGIQIVQEPGEGIDQRAFLDRRPSSEKEEG
jgi:transcriptional regulator with XRE-family HTH domain